MFKANPLNRRSFLGTAAASIVAVEMSFRGSEFANAGRPKGLQLAPIKQIKAGVLDVGYYEIGASAGPPVLLRHGWPYDVHSYTDVAPMLATPAAG